jgi:hypothetical protein
MGPTWIEALEAGAAMRPKSATYLIRDTEVKGFVLVVTPAGGKSYGVDYRAGTGRRAPKRRYTIGKHGSPWTPQTARAQAKLLLGNIEDGDDPAERRAAERKGLTLAELCDRYLAEGAAHKKAPRSRQIAAGSRIISNGSWAVSGLIRSHAAMSSECSSTSRQGLGHKHAATTARYSHLSADPLRAANEAVGARIAAAMKGRAEDGTGDNVVSLPGRSRS